MTVHTSPREQQRVADLAREYRQKGYTVIVEPRPDQLPDFLAAFRIDMLAENAEEQVVVEVRTQESLVDAPELDAIAQALHNQPAWRFELVVTNPRDRGTFQPKDAASLNERDIAYRLQEARQLSEQEHGEAALLIAWSATEALLRAIADQEALPGTASNPSQLTKSLYTYGALDKAQYEILQQALNTRALVTHGYKEQRTLSTMLDQLLQVADALLEHYVSS